MSGIAAELELENELEGELELENELENEQENELELENELVHELVHEHEQEHEQEQEHEAFFNHLAAMADRGGRPQALRRIALAAARSALRTQSRPYPAIEGELEAELEAPPAVNVAAGPAERVHAAAMMEHLGHAAAEAANEQEAAEHFLPLIGLAAKFVAPKLLSFAAKKIGGKLLGKAGSKLIRRVAPRVIGRIVPRLTRGIANVTRTLYRQPGGRPLLHAVPRIARGTMRTLVRRVARGRRITPQFATRTLARQTMRTLSNPRILRHTYRRSRLWDQRFHRYGRRYLGRPRGPYVRAAAMPTVIGTGPAAMPVVTGAAVPATGSYYVCRCAGRPIRVAGVPGAPAQVAGLPVISSICPTCGR